MIAILAGVRYLIVVLVSVSLIVNYVEHLFVRLLAFNMSSLENDYSCTYLLLIGFFFFIYIEMNELSIYFGYLALNGSYHLHIFPHSVGCLFVWLMVSFSVQMFLHLIWMNSWIMNSFAETYVKSIVPIFSSRSLTASSLIFRSLMYFMFILYLVYSSAQSLSRVQLFATPWITACQASLSITNSWSILKLMPIELVMPSSHLILCHPLLLLSPIPPGIRVLSNESTLRIRWPKYWSFSFSISPSNEHPGLISFRMVWLDLLAVYRTLKSLLQHHSSKASIFQHSAFLTVQLSHPHMTSRKTIALTRWNFVGKVMSLLFNMLSRLVIIFLPRSKRLLICC